MHYHERKAVRGPRFFRYVADCLFDGDDNRAVRVQPCRICGDAFVAADTGAGSQVEAMFMKGANNHAVAHETIRKRAAAVRAARLNGENLAASRMKHSDVLAFDNERAPLALRYLCDRSNRDFGGHAIHRQE
jgi:hypothetical protein